MTTFVFKNLRQLFDKYAVARTEHDALVKSTTKIFSNFVAFSENPNFTTVSIEGHFKEYMIYSYIKKCALYRALSLKRQSNSL